MAFFGIASAARGQGTARAGQVSAEFLHRHECAACPLNAAPGLRTPHMAPSGAARPMIYLLGDAPGRDDDRKGKPFAGSAGRILRHHLPRRWLEVARMSSVVRTMPPDRAPAWAEVEACRPSVARDIEQSAPSAVIGLGGVPLSWALGQSSGIELWSGLRAPIKSGSHACWFFPIIHPADVQRDHRWRGLQRDRGRYGSELEFQFAVNLRDALAAVEAGLPEPIVHSREDVLADVDWVTGAGSDDLDRVRRHLEAAAGRKVAGVDYETTKHSRPQRVGAKILSASVATQQDGALAFPFDHAQARWSRDERRALDDLWYGFLTRAECKKVSHHLPFELEWSAYFYGEEVVRAGLWEDTHSQAFVLDGRVHDENRQRRGGVHGLGALTLQYFGVDIKALAGVDRANLEAEPLPDVLRYNGADAKYHRLVYLEQGKKLLASGQQALYRDHCERVPTVVLTQLAGIPIDQPTVCELGDKYLTRMGKIQRELAELPAVKKFERGSGRAFRPSANEDVKGVLLLLGHKVGSTDEAVLAEIDNAFARTLLRWRKAAKLFGTYVLPVADDATRDALGAADMREGVLFPDGMIHPVTSTNKVRTSRTSSEDPNYQNWPKRGADNAVEIRRVVKPLPPLVIVSFDYGQIQARNVGMESLDQALLAAFWSEYDVHADFMERCARLHPAWVKEGSTALLATDDKVRKKYRNISKNKFVFPSFFGAGVKSRAAGMGVPEDVSTKLDAYFKKKFPDIPAWHQRIEREYRRTGYVTGLSGYRRYAPVSWNELINSPIQADESKIVLDAMCRLSRKCEDEDRFIERLGGRLLQARMEIHDDLTFIWPKQRVDELKEVVVPIMLEVPYPWARATPIVVEMEIGEDWGSMRAPEEHVFASNKYDGIDMPRTMPQEFIR